MSFLKNANTAVTMSVDYIVRLVNRLNGEQIIREASLIITSPKKYGKKLLKLELRDKPQSQKIVNKIYKKNFESTELFIDPAQNVTSTISNQNTVVAKSVEYVPIFFTKSNISVSTNSYLIKENNDQDEVVFEKGKLRFIISPFDNYLKFKFYTTVNNKAVPLDLNNNPVVYRAVFEIVFNIPSSSSEEILQSDNRNFYITSVGQDGTETLMYNGEWRKPSEQADVEDAIAAAKEAANARNNIESKITEIEEKLKAQTAKIQTSTVLLNNLKNIPGLVTKKPTKAISTVNRFGMKSPSKIRSNRGNAGNR